MQTMEIHRDLETRMVPSAEQERLVTEAFQAFRAEHGRDPYGIYAGLALPGKEYGIWEFGQPVEHNLQLYVAATAADHGDCTLGATYQAARQLGERPGVTVWGVWHQPGRCALFEEILDPLTLLDFGARRLDTIARLAT